MEGKLIMTVTPPSPHTSEASSPLLTAITILAIVGIMMGIAIAVGAAETPDRTSGELVITIDDDSNSVTATNYGNSSETLIVERDNSTLSDTEITVEPGETSVTAKGSGVVV